MINLPTSQSDDDDDNTIQILRPINEKSEISSFANGLQNSELRTIIKARNYATLRPYKERTAGIPYAWEFSTK